MNKNSYKQTLYVEVNKKRALYRFVSKNFIIRIIVVEFIFSFEFDKVGSVRIILLGASPLGIPCAAKDNRANHL